jgi:hypothetical protein
MPTEVASATTSVLAADGAGRSNKERILPALALTITPRATATRPTRVATINLAAGSNRPHTRSKILVDCMKILKRLP